MSTPAIVFIHGAFVTRHCWDAWISRYEAKGYRCLTIEWPGRDQPVQTLKQNHPDPALGRLGLAELVEHHAAAVQSLGEKPVLIGHSLGGLITQLLLQRDLGVAGVAVDSAAPQGVLSLQWSFIKAGWPILNPFISANAPYSMSFEEFQYAFANTLPLAEQRLAYDTQIVPESRLALRGLLTGVARVDFSRPRPPLLLIAGSRDNFIPASLNRTNAAKYQASPSVTDFKEFSGRCHYTIGEKGWEDVADYALTWLDQHGTVN